MVHILLFAIVAVALFPPKNRKLFLSIAFTALFLFAALRYNFGNDYTSYEGWYHYIREGNPSPFDYEYLFTYLNEIFPSYILLVAFVTLVYVGGIKTFVMRSIPENYAAIGLLIFVINPYLFLVNISAMRQSIAIIIFIAAVQFAIKRKPIPYVALILIASLFHKTAILLIPAYFLCGTRKKIGRQWLLIIPAIVLVLLFAVNIDAFAEWLMMQFNESTYNHYLTGESTNSLRATILTSIFFLYVLLNLPRMEGKTRAYAKLYLVGTILGILAYRLSMITRFQMYFDIFSVVVIPCIIAQSYRKSDKIIVQDQLHVAFDVVNKFVFPPLILVIYILRYYSFFITPTWESFLEYHTIFSLM